MTRARLVDVVTRAGLRGRGGAGFPTGTKLDAVRRSAAGGTRTRRSPIVVANGTEGEPASIKDTILLTLAPHLVLDGIVAAAGGRRPGGGHLRGARYRQRSRPCGVPSTSAIAPVRRPWR